MFTSVRFHQIASRWTLNVLFSRQPTAMQTYNIGLYYKVSDRMWTVVVVLV